MLISSFLDSCKFWTESNFFPELTDYIDPMVSDLNLLKQQIPGPISQERIDRIKQLATEIKTSIESTFTFRNRIKVITLDDDFAVMETAYAIFEDYFSQFPDDRLNITCLNDILKLIQEMKETIKTTMFKNVENYLNIHDGLSGIWYPIDYENAVQKPIDETYYAGYADNEFFKRTSPFTFEIINGKLPSEAVIEFLNGPTITDCGGALAACFYKTLFDIVGEKFNTLFQLKGFQLKIDQSIVSDDSPSRFFTDYTINAFAMKNLLPREVGDVVYIWGVPEQLYCFKHPAGHGLGLYAIYRGKNENNENTFVAHFFNGVKTEKEIVSLLIELYNQAPNRLDELFKEKERAIMKVLQIRFDEYIKRKKIDLSEFLSDLSISNTISRK